MSLASSRGRTSSGVSTSWLVGAMVLALGAIRSAGAQQDQNQAEWLTQLRAAIDAQKADDYPAAVTLYQAAVAAGVPVEHQLGVATNLGLALHRAGRPAEAVDMFDRILKAQPSNGDAHHNRGSSLYALGRYEEALQAYTAAIEINPSDGGSHFGRGNAADKLGNHDLAVEAFGAVVRLDATDADALYNQANALKSSGRYDEALEVYERTLKLAPANAAAHTNMGFSLDMLGRHSEAVASFLKGISLDADDAIAFSGLGASLKATGATAESAAAYRRAIEMEPTASRHLGLANTLKSTDPSAAASAFAQARSMDTDGLEAANAVRKWLEATGVGARRNARQLDAEARFPESLESRAGPCEALSADEVRRLEAAGEPLLEAGAKPRLLRQASAGWRARGWTDDALRASAGDLLVEMLAMPGSVHPTLDEDHDALLEPARSAVFLGDFLDLSHPAKKATPFSAYLAMCNLLALPQLMRDICPPKVLPARNLTVVNLWAGGELMKNGLHYDATDNLLFQLRGRKRVLLFPPEDEPSLYYGPAQIRTHKLELDAAEFGIANVTLAHKVRQNVAKLNIFDAHVEASHPELKRTSPQLCELDEGDALFLPKRWSHAVLSVSPEGRNLAVNMWFDASVPSARSEASHESFLEMLQQDGCGQGVGVKSEL